MEYGYKQAVADGINVNYDAYRICATGSEKTGCHRHEFDFERLGYGT